MEKELGEWYRLHRFYFYMGEYQTKDLAVYLKVSPRTIQRWLKDKTRPSKEQLVQITRYLTQNKPKTSL